MGKRKAGSLAGGGTGKGGREEGGREGEWEGPMESRRAS